MAGAPTKYKIEFNEQAEKLCKLGATDKEIADFFDVSESTINNWKIEYVEFLESIKKGKILADANVANALYLRATGYSHPDVDIKMFEGQIIETPLIKHYPPDTAAINIWLKNRRGKVEVGAQRWADKVETGFTDNEGKDVKPQIIFQPAPNCNPITDEAGNTINQQ